MGIAFYSGADYAAICFAFFPVIVVLVGIFGAIVKKATLEQLEATKVLGGVTEEILSAVKLVTSFAKEDTEFGKFAKLAENVKNVAHKQEVLMSAILGFFKMFIFGFYVYSLYIGSIYIEKHKKNPSKGYAPYDVGALLKSLISMMAGMLVIFGLTPNI